MAMYVWDVHVPEGVQEDAKATVVALGIKLILKNNETKTSIGLLTKINLMLQLFSVIIWEYFYYGG